MSLLESKLKGLVNQEIVVVMVDNRAFRGTLVDFDAGTMILRNVVEALPNNAAGWEEPTASTGIVHKVVTYSGVFSHEDTRAEVVRLKDAIVQNAHVLRIWEWSSKNVERPEHVQMGEDQGPLHGTRVSRRL